jgi:hypothetical protein
MGPSDHLLELVAAVLTVNQVVRPKAHAQPTKVARVLPSWGCD